jgi:ADP-ribosyl-[dinitrogen reductase] hydrolase
MLAFHFLRRATPYEEAIKATLMKGGDTDTNAAIVGGMMGALHGASAIPERMKQPVLTYREGQPRPGALHARHIPGLAVQLWEKGTNGEG